MSRGVWIKYSLSEQVYVVFLLFLAAVLRANGSETTPKPKYEVNNITTTSALQSKNDVVCSSAKDAASSGEQFTLDCIDFTYYSIGFQNDTLDDALLVGIDSPILIKIQDFSTIQEFPEADFEKQSICLDQEINTMQTIFDIDIG